ncbi:simple sugar transport system ATP-binding protein/ribose transport system ATP-binding protein [Roseiarcus fermentans]|uniref:Simple sugar transport system ATP-binding protein/ribose transport system ATP-binding protein n=1 Tax=Roseiarcus fermentans TaxID=1473586 RepID=A0A366FWT1_9HYPH|nr:sugar ABC transporter ATP-binding protein [Roseiarcus fermentans]RBP18195.1 simple sugar transport system ATP-binding protein/ribose transport system ATP-binding protein [Roseiarcus fermentans]
MTDVVEFRDATKAFRGNPAFRNVNLTLRKGEVLALVGENGAGKSTLTKVLAGLYRLTSGELRLEGAPVQFASPAEALRCGVAMVFQETNLIPSMTVAQNIFLGAENFFNRLRGVNIAAQQHLQSLNFPVEPTALVSSLGAAKKQMVEIARAVHHKARIFIFDEPTATLTPEEKQHFFALIGTLKKQDASIIFISHALEEALTIADRIAVLRDGQLIVADDAKNFTRERIVQAMVGRQLTAQLYGGETARRRVRKRGEKVLALENVTMGKAVRGATLSVYAGQITGMFGLVGAGRTEMMKIAAGVLKRDFWHGGRIKLRGEPVRFRVPRQAVERGVAYVTEDRKLDGLFESMRMAQNVFLGRLAMGANPVAYVTMAEARRQSERWLDALNVRAIDKNAKVIELSGGNQQKIVVAKSLIQNPSLIIFDEPTRGVDVGAIAEIHHMIQSLADAGAAVVVISSYLPEILSLSDRILVARQGRIVEEMTVDEATEEKIMYAAVH